MYTAAVRRGAADNIAAGHGQLPAGCDIHTAAIIYYCTAGERKRIARTAGDDAAGDGLCAACLVQHPQVAILLESVREITRIAVLDSQLPTALDHNHAAVVCALIFEHMTVQVQRHGAVDGQGVADANVPCQLDGVDIRISNSRSQGRLVADFCYRSARGGRLALATQRRQGRLRLGVGHFPLRLGVRHFFLRLGVGHFFLRLGCRIVCGLDVFCAILRRSTLCAADRAILIHAFRRAGCFTAACGRGFRAFLRKSRCWHKAQQHTQGKQGAYDSLFHLVSFALCCPLAALQ